MSRILVIPFLIRVLDIYEIAVNFNDAQHQGDKRKRSQQCSMEGADDANLEFQEASLLVGSTVTAIPPHFGYVWCRVPTICGIK